MVHVQVCFWYRQNTLVDKVAVAAHVTNLDNNVARQDDSVRERSNDGCQEELRSEGEGEGESGEEVERGESAYLA